MPLTTSSTLALLVASVAVASSSSANAAEPTKAQCVAANEEAQTLERAGQLLRARDRSRACTNDACPGPVRDDCFAMAERIEGNLPTVVFDVHGHGDAALQAVDVTVDRSSREPWREGHPLAVDPGEHTFDVVAAGYVPLRRTLTLRAGEHRREALQLVVAGSDDGRVVQAEPLRASAVVWVLGGIGIAGIVVGSIFGGMTISEHAFSNAHCPDGACTQSAVDAENRAHTDAAVSTVAFVVGLGGIAGAGYLLFRGASVPRTTRVEWRATIGARNIGVLGRW